MALHIIEHDPAQPATLTLPAPKLSAEDKKALTKLIAALDRTDEAMGELNKFADKPAANALIESWALGTAPLAEALAAAAFLLEDRKDAIIALRSGAKRAARKLRVEASQILAKVVEGQAEAAAAAANRLEQNERVEAEAVRVAFEPSATCRGIHKTAQRFKDRAKQLAGGDASLTVAELKALL